MSARDDFAKAHQQKIVENAKLLSNFKFDRFVYWMIFLVSGTLYLLNFHWLFLFTLIFTLFLYLNSIYCRHYKEAKKFAQWNFPAIIINKKISLTNINSPNHESATEEIADGGYSIRRVFYQDVEFIFDDGNGQEQKVTARLSKKNLGTEPFWVLMGPTFPTGLALTDQELAKFIADKSITLIK